MDQQLEILESTEDNTLTKSENESIEWLVRGLDFSNPRDREIHIGFACSCSTYCDAIIDEDDGEVV